MMGILLCIILLLLGAIAAAPVINEKIPASRSFISSLTPYQDIIGIIGLIYGVVMVLKALQILSLAGIVPISLFSIIAALVTLSLGFIYGVDFIRKNIKDPNAPFLISLENVRLKLLPYKEKLGLAAIAVAIISLLLYL